MSPFSKI